MAALRAIQDDRLRDTLQQELASLANKIVVADRLPVDQAESLRHAVDKATAYVNLGLQLRGHDTAERAAGELAEVFVEHLFRIAQTEVSQAIKEESGFLLVVSGDIGKTGGEWVGDAASHCLDEPPVHQANIGLNPCAIGHSSRSVRGFQLRK